MLDQKFNLKRLKINEKNTFFSMNQQHLDFIKRSEYLNNLSELYVD